MAAHCILIIDDDPKIRTLLRDVFETGGFDVRDAAGSETALKILASETIDLITLDLQLMGEDGLDVARSIRKSSRVPIIMVTGRDDVVDRVVGLELGADDYITKPFHVREVLARVRSVLRRAEGGSAATGVAPEQVSEISQTPTSPAFAFDEMVLVPDRMELFDRNGALCELTSGEFRLLNVFLQNAKRILSRDRLMDLSGGTEWNPLDRTIDNQVARLRKKIERDPAKPQIIKTVRGTGYSFTTEVTQLQPDAVPSSVERSVASSR